MILFSDSFARAKKTGTPNLPRRDCSQTLHPVFFSIIFHHCINNRVITIFGENLDQINNDIQRYNII